MDEESMLIEGRIQLNDDHSARRYDMFGRQIFLTMSMAGFIGSIYYLSGGCDCFP